jgi:hypothetical protein
MGDDIEFVDAADAPQLLLADPARDGLAAGVSILLPTAIAK